MIIEDLIEQRNQLRKLREEVRSMYIFPIHSHYDHIVGNVGSNISIRLENLESNIDEELPRIQKDLDGLREYIELVRDNADFAQIEMRSEGYSDIPSSGGEEIPNYPTRAVERFKTSKV